MTEQEMAALARAFCKITVGNEPHEAPPQCWCKDCETILAAFKRVAAENFNAGVDASNRVAVSLRKNDSGLGSLERRAGYNQAITDVSKDVRALKKPVPR